MRVKRWFKKSFFDIKNLYFDLSKTCWIHVSLLIYLLINNYIPQDTMFTCDEHRVSYSAIFPCNFAVF